MYTYPILVELHVRHVSKACAPLGTMSDPTETISLASELAEDIVEAVGRPWAHFHPGGAEHHLIQSNSPMAFHVKCI